MTVFVANTNLLTLSGLKSQVEGTFVNDATVEVTITDLAGNVMTGTGWPTFPLSMPYVATSDGDYRAVLADTIPFTAGKPYLAKIDANAGVNRIGQWKFQFTPETRS